MNCHMEMQGCIFCAKPGVGLLLAHRHHPVSTGYPANAMHRGVVVPAGATHWAGVGLVLDRRLRRWPSIEPALARCVVFAGVLMLGHHLRRWPGAGSTVVRSCLHRVRLGGSLPSGRNALGRRWFGVGPALTGVDSTYCVR